MAQLKTSPGDKPTAREITDYLAYLRQQLQYEIDMREKLEKEIANTISQINAQIEDILERIEDLEE